MIWSTAQVVVIPFRFATKTSSVGIGTSLRLRSRVPSARQRIRHFVGAWRGQVGTKYEHGAKAVWGPDPDGIIPWGDEHLGKHNPGGRLNSEGRIHTGRCRDDGGPSFRWSEDVLTLLTGTGFSDALHIYRALFGFIHGHVLNELQEIVENPDETDDLLRLGLQRLPIGKFPFLRHLASVLISYDGATELERELDLLLTGLKTTLIPSD